MRNLRKFKTETDMVAWQKGINYVSPNLVLCDHIVYYNIPSLSGVFIQHVDGTLYRMNEWTEKGFDNTEANGIAVVDHRASFVLAKEGLSGSATWSSDMSNEIEGVTTTSKKSEAIVDYRGYENTLEIAKTDTIGCAYLCVNYSFPNGATGYMPAAGEWNIVLENWDDVNSAMTIIDVPKLQFGKCYWTSTQANASSAWIARGVEISSNIKNQSWSVHPLTKLESW